MSKQVRIAIIDKDKCRPKKCNHECKLKCPVNGAGKQCVDIEDIAKVATISEDLCIGCGICVKVCPFNAVQMVNLPSEIHNQMVYTYGESAFRLYKLPVPKLGQIIGFVGQNGIGKSTLMKILSNELLPNFGNDVNLTHKDILNKTKGTELQKYLKALYDGKLIVKSKPQNIDQILRDAKKHDKNMSVNDLIMKYYSMDNKEWNDKIINRLDLAQLSDNQVTTLSGGELQRLICATIMMQKADVYIFDEPTNYLDVRQRLNIAKLIRELSDHTNYIFIVEHDMSILDFTSDLICVMYGKPGAYGVISTPYNTNAAINIFFEGYIPADNIRFRPEAFVFKETAEIQESLTTYHNYKYSDGLVEFDNFKLSIVGGEFSRSSMVLLLGQNGTGKTTFLNYLAKQLGLSVSYKQQYNDLTQFINKFNEYPTVHVMLMNKIYKQLSNAQFCSDVLNPLDIKRLYDKRLDKLSGGELQRVMIVYVLGTDADVYLIDEPSANLDVEQRVSITKVIKRFLLHNKKSGFIVEHDMMMSMAMSMENTSRIIVFDKDKSVSTTSSPLPFSTGINRFLEQMDITFRTDSKASRPRINKKGGSKDMEQKKDNKYYL
jgi:ATP-binding cassette subfamily E protein 1